MNIFLSDRASAGDSKNAVLSGFLSIQIAWVCTSPSIFLGNMTHYPKKISFMISEGAKIRRKQS